MDKLSRKRMIAIAKDTVRNPAKALLGGPSLSEAKKILKKFGVKKKMGGGMMKSTRGYGAARTSGMGLQDEQLQPGTVMKAKGGVSVKTKLNGTLKTQTY